MSAPTYEEMESKRQEMIHSFRDVAAAMTRCVAVIEDYVRSSPVDLSSGGGALGLGTTGDVVQDVKKKRRQNKVTKPKDPNAPKRPPSAYLLYQNQVREPIRSKYPDLPYKEILTMVAEGWRNLTEVQKKPYEESYAQADEVYKEADKAYKESLGFPIAAAAAVAEADDDDDDDSDSDSDSDSDDATPVAHSTVNPAMIRSTPVTKSAALPASAPVQTPATLALAASEANGTVKKDKKRKNKEEEAQVNAALEPVADKKTKKKTKKLDAAA